MCTYMHIYIYIHIYVYISVYILFDPTPRSSEAGRVFFPCVEQFRSVGCFPVVGKRQRRPKKVSFRGIFMGFKMGLKWVYNAPITMVYVTYTSYTLH